MIPYGKQSIDDSDIEAVVEVLRSDWLTTGPKVKEFERALADFTGTRHAVAVSNGTAALHSAMFALNIGPGDEVIVPAVTFAATANCVIYQGGTPIFADVHPDTLLIDPADVEEKITARTKAIIAVDYAGQPCDYERLREIAQKHGLMLIADACHALGAQFRNRRVGSLADITVFSFHPVKIITSGEGGMLTLDSNDMNDRLQRFRNHGINSDFRTRETLGTWHYEMVELGYNYRMTDLQSALGLNQLRKLSQFLNRRHQIASIYDKTFARDDWINPLAVKKEVFHAYHLYVVRVDFESAGISRSDAFQQLRKKGVGVNVHYLPVYLHPYYQNKFGTRAGFCPIAESITRQILSLPIHPEMSEADVESVVRAVRETIYPSARSSND
jgi:perosamine synthetase